MRSGLLNMKALASLCLLVSLSMVSGVQHENNDESNETLGMDTREYLDVVLRYRSMFFGL